jgi:hypothetical protein
MILRLFYFREVLFVDYKKHRDKKGEDFPLLGGNQQQPFENHWFVSKKI